MYPIERRLGYLKKTVRNKSRPEGSIAGGYIVDECLSFCSTYLDDHIEMRLNKAKRNQDDHRIVGQHEFGMFSDGAKCLGKSSLMHFEKEFDSMVWYVLSNCDEAQSYIE
jgi:hypothetical protein